MDAVPTKAAVDVSTPSIAVTPDGVSSTKTPGWISSGIR
jgi:hypothetical protein